MKISHFCLAGVFVCNVLVTSLCLGMVICVTTKASFKVALTFFRAFIGWPMSLFCCLRIAAVIH